MEEQRPPPDLLGASTWDIVHKFHALVDGVSRATTDEAIHEHALTALMAMVRPDRASVLMLDEQGVMRFQAWRHLSDAYREAVEGHSPWSRDVRDPDPVLVASVHEDPGLEPFGATFEAEGIAALAFIPLVGQGRLLGKFMLYYDRPHAFSEEEVQVATTIAHHVAFGVHRLRTEAAIRESLVREQNARTEAEAALRMLERLQAVTDAVRHVALDDLLRELLQRVCVALECDTATVLLQREGEEVLVPVASFGLREEVDETVRVPRGHGVAGRVAVTGKPMIVEDLTGVQVFSGFLQEHVRSLAAVPLYAGDKIIGVIHVGTRMQRTFTVTDVQLLERIAARAALAIEQSLLHAAERRARADAEAANRAKDEFLAMLAHELRTPLGVIVNAIAILDRTGSQDAEPARARRLVGEHVHHLARLLDDLLDAARITSGRIVLRREPVDVRTALGAALDAQRPRIDEKRQRLELLVPDTPVTVLGDPTRLQQVLGNLISNAWKYTQAGGTIRVAVTADAGEVSIRVQDDGIGIPPSRLDDIFGLFVQADPTPSRAESGLGVGLTLVKKLVELHGGSVVARSGGAGAGAEFEVTLPVGRTSPVGEWNDERGTGTLRRILIVEDNDDAREGLAAALRLDGHEVHEAAWGEQGVELAARHLPEAVVVDIGLPDMDGFEVCRRIREQLGAVRVVALTGHAGAPDRERGASAGFDAYLVKPVDPSDLMRVVNRLWADVAA